MGTISCMAQNSSMLYLLLFSHLSEILLPTDIVRTTCCEKSQCLPYIFLTSPGIIQAAIRYLCIES